MDRKPGWISRRDREEVRLAGSVLLASGRSIAVTIIDFSGDGCRLECGETLPIAATVNLELGGAIASAQVRWALGGSAGLQMLRSRVSHANG